MRSQAEIRRYHDMLGGIVVGDCQLPFFPEDRLLMHMAFDALCWVLEHKNEAFAESMSRIEEYLGAHGVKYVPVEELN